MSQHPSLRSKGPGKAHRSVWKRFERLKFLVGKEKWTEENSVFGMEKMKLIKLKVKKEKKVVDEGAEGAVGTDAAAAGAPAAGGAKADGAKKSAK